MCSVVKWVSPHEAIHQPHNKAQHDAQDDAGCDREEDGGVLAAVADVARQLSEGNIRAVSEYNDDADQEQQSTGNYEELAQGTHGFILARWGKCWDSLLG